MKLFKQSSLVVFSLSCLMSIGSAVFAHGYLGAPLLPLHGLIAARSNLLNHQAEANYYASFPYPGSLANKHVLTYFKGVVENGLAAGQEQGALRVQRTIPGFTGGTVTGGVLQGDLYTNIGGDAYINAGEFVGTIGSNISANHPVSLVPVIGGARINPNIQDSVTFASQSQTGTITVLPPSHVGGGGGAPRGLLLSYVPGSQRSLLGQTFNLTGTSVAQGNQIGINKALSELSQVTTFSGGPVTGGVFFGTLYRNSLFNSNYQSYPFLLTGSAKYVFAFGNNPLNNPGFLPSIRYIPTEPSTIFFSDGVSGVISSGQVLYPMIGRFGLARNGAVFTIGANPANNGLINQRLSNLNSFLNF